MSVRTVMNGGHYLRLCPAMGTVRRLAPAAGDVALGRAANAYLVTLSGAEQASTHRTYSRILRRVVDEFGAETAPDTVDAERFAEWFGSWWVGRARPRGTSPSMPSGQPQRTVSGKASSPPTSAGCWSCASRGSTAAMPCPAARSTNCSPARASACASGRSCGCCTRPPPGRPWCNGCSG
jgi:hypothetical protein